MRRRAVRAFCLLALPGLLLAVPGCGIVVQQAEKAADYSRHAGHIGRYGRLTEEELAWAKTAWRYFDRNTNPDNGLVNAFDRYPIFSMWHVADYMAALAAARDFGLLDERQFDARLSRLLGFLNTMDLSEGSVPNRYYNSVTGKMVNEANQPEDVGWSAIDTGRLLAWMRIIGTRYPQYREYLDKAVLRWNFCQVIDDCGTLFGVSRSSGKRQRRQEGRLGYEQLAAAGFAAWGFDAARIWRARAGTVTLFGAPVPYDPRDPRTDGVQAPVLTMPYVLMGMEYGWRYPGHSPGSVPGDAVMEEFARRVYAVQEARYRRQGVLTAKSDYRLREAPYVVTDAIFNAGVPWTTYGADGKEHERLALVSTRAAFGMWALWPGDYTDRLMQSVKSLHEPERGWYEGRFEASGAALEQLSLSTNAMVLETLLFKVRGQLHPERAEAGYFDLRAANAFARPGKCLPVERPVCSAPGNRPGLHSP